MLSFLVIFFVILVVIIVIFDFWASSFDADHFHFSDENVINGLEPTQRIHGSDVAICCVHGYTDSPEIFDQFLTICQELQADFYIPLQPYHGRGATALIDFDPWVMENALKQSLEEICARHKKVILLGQSLGGLLINQVLVKYKFANISHVFLWAPAAFLKDNTQKNRNLLTVVSAITNFLPGGPSKSSDAQAFLRHEKAKIPKWDVLPAISRLFYYSSQAESRLLDFHLPVTLCVAKDDNRVDAERLSQLVQGKSHVNLQLLEEGRHLLYWSSQIKYLAGLVIDAAKSA